MTAFKNTFNTLTRQGLLTLLGVVCFCSASIANDFKNYPGITTSTAYEKALRDYYNGDFEKALEQLEELDPTKHKYLNILKGVIYTKQGLPEKATSLFNSLQVEDGLKPYMSYITMVKHLQMNQKAEASQILQSSLSSSEAPYIGKKSILAFADYYYRQNEYAMATRQVERLLSDPRKDEIIFTGAKRLLIDMGIESRNLDQVLVEYGKMIQHYPEVDLDKSLLKHIQYNFKHHITIHDTLFGPYENLLYLKNLYRLREYEEVEKQATHMITTFPDFRYISQVYLILGKTYYFQFKFGQSVPTLRRALLFDPLAKDWTEVLFFVGMSYVKQRDYNEANETFIALIDRINKSSVYKKSANPHHIATAYYYLSDHFRDRGPYKNYKKFLDDFKNNHFNTHQYNQFIWENDWLDLMLDVKNNANKPRNKNQPSVKESPGVNGLKTLTNHETIGKKLVDWYHWVIKKDRPSTFGSEIFDRGILYYPQSYYSSQVLKKYFDFPEHINPYEPHDVRNKTHESFERFDALFLAGFGDMGLEEIQYYLTSTDSLSPMHVFEKTKLLFKMGRTHLAIRAIEDGTPFEAKKFGVLSRGFLKMAYPIDHIDLVSEYAEKYRIDPLLALAIIRESSQFDTTLVKNDRYGLYQLDLDLAKRLNIRLGMRWPGKDALLTPEYNIKLGTYYAAWLMENFDYMFHYAIASFDVTPQIVQKWISGYRDKNLTDFQDKIVYPETNDFLERVLNSYIIYSALYRPELG